MTHSGRPRVESRLTFGYGPYDMRQPKVKKSSHYIILVPGRTLRSGEGPRSSILYQFKNRVSSVRTVQFSTTAHRGCTVFESCVEGVSRSDPPQESLALCVDEESKTPRSRVSMHECFSLVQGTYYPLH